MALNFPDSPTLNQVYTDTTSGFSYQWDGVVWQSYTPSATKNILVLDDISGSFNSSTTIFNLTNSGTAVTPANSQQLRVTLGGIVQEPGTDYIVAASTIIFTTAPDFGIDCSIVSLGPAVASDAPNSGTIFARQEYNPTGIQTTFTVTNNYSVGYLEVYHNGVKLVDGTDFTATNGTTFDLTVAAQNGDVIEAIVYLQTSLYTLGAFANDLTILGNATVAGITTLGGTVKVGVGTTALIVEGDARITGILTVGSSSITLDGPNDTITVQTLNTTNIIGVGATFTGNVSIGGTLTYEDVTNVDSVGLITARNGAIIKTGTATTSLIVEGDARVTGILTVGSSSITLDGSQNQVNVGAGVTIHHTNGVQVGGNTLNSNGLTVNNFNSTGVSTFSGIGTFSSNISVGGTITELSNNQYWNVVTQSDVGIGASQISLNQHLGRLAFADEIGDISPGASPPINNLDINFEYVSNTSIRIRMRGSDGTVRSTTLTLS